MAGQRGRDVVIRIGDGGEPETFATVAGIRTRGIALSARLVDATTAQSPQAWRELLAGAASAIYSTDDQATDFPVGGTALIEVAQLGADGQPGAWAGVEVLIPTP